MANRTLSELEKAVGRRHNPANPLLLEDATLNSAGKKVACDLSNRADVILTHQTSLEFNHEALSPPPK